MAVDASHPYCVERDGTLYVSETPAEKVRELQRAFDDWERRARLVPELIQTIATVMGLVAGVLVATSTFSASTAWLPAIAIGAIAGFVFGSLAAAVVRRGLRRTAGPMPQVPHGMPVPPQVADNASSSASASELMDWSHAASDYLGDISKVPTGIAPGITNQYISTSEAMQAFVVQLQEKRQKYLAVAVELGFTPHPAPVGIEAAS